MQVDLKDRDLQKEPLCAFLNDGNIEISNNAAERAVRQVVIGRKNWMFSDTQDGARATAIAYSIMNTAKFNGLRVFEYLEYLLDTMYRTPKNLLDLNKLLPWSQEMQAAFRMECPPVFLPTTVLLSAYY